MVGEGEGRLWDDTKRKRRRRRRREREREREREERERQRDKERERNRGGDIIKRKWSGKGRTKRRKKVNFTSL